MLFFTAVGLVFCGVIAFIISFMFLYVLYWSFMILPDWYYYISRCEKPTIRQMFYSYFLIWRGEVTVLKEDDHGN